MTSKDTSKGRKEMWFCYYTDFSGMAIFDNELDALRYAVEHSMSCQQVVNGDLKEQLS